jgi:hypothetical protein
MIFMTCPLFLQKKSVRIFLVAVIILCLSGVSVGLYLYNKQHKDLTKVKADYVLEAHELVTAFGADENAASAKYINKVIEVTGLVTWAEFGSADSTLSLTLTGYGDNSGVICTFNGITEKSQVSFKDGERLTVRGECSGMLLDVLLNNCAVVSK